MLSNNGRDGNRKSRAADHLTPEPKESFALQRERLIAFTTDKATTLIHLYNIVNSEWRTGISF
jgi:hypothetical protein